MVVVQRSGSNCFRQKMKVNLVVFAWVGVS